MKPNHRTALAGLLTTTLLLGGCVATQPAREDDPALTALAEKARANPADQATRVQLIDAYLKRYNQTRDRRDLDRAIAELRSFLEVSPEHAGANITLYQLLTSRTLRNGDRRYLPELRTIYQRAVILKETPLPPPSLLDAVLTLDRSNGRADLPAAIKLGRTALKENPRHVGTRLLLARLYREHGNDALSLAMLEQAYHLAPDNPKVLQRYGNHLYKVARTDLCADSNPQLDPAIRVLRQASTAQPKDAELLYRLAMLYQMRGRGELSLFTAKRLAEVEDTPTNQAFLAGQYNLAGQRDEAVRHFEQLLAAQPDDPDLLNSLAHVHFQNAEWATARGLFLRHLQHAKTPDPYAVLLLSLTDRLGGNDAAARQHLAALPDRAFDKDWERSLVAYLLDKVDAPTLQQRAQNRCERLEAHYFIGFKQWLARDDEAARRHFAEAMALNIPSFYEHHSAAYLAPRLARVRGDGRFARE